MRRTGYLVLCLLLILAWVLPSLAQSEVENGAYRAFYGEKDPQKKIEALYRLCYARTPSAAEVTLGLNFLKTAEMEKTDSKQTPWERYAQVLLLANEFAFAD